VIHRAARERQVACDPSSPMSDGLGLLLADFGQVRRIHPQATG